MKNIRGRLGSGLLCGLLLVFLPVVLVQTAAGNSSDPADDPSANEVLRRCHSYRHWLHGAILHTSTLEVDDSGTFLNATHDVAPHWHNLPGIHFDWEEVFHWDYALDDGARWLFAIQGILFVHTGLWDFSLPVWATCTVTLENP